MRLKEIIGTIREADTIIVFITALFIFAPGIAAMFINDRPLFEALDWVKIILLAISLSLPVILINALFIFRFVSTSKQYTLRQEIVLACLSSAFAIYGALLLQYTTGHAWNFMTNFILAQSGVFGSILYEERLSAPKMRTSDTGSNGAI